MLKTKHKCATFDFFRFKHIKYFTLSSQPYEYFEDFLHFLLILFLVVIKSANSYIGMNRLERSRCTIQSQSHFDDKLNHIGFGRICQHGTNIYTD